MAKWGEGDPRWIVEERPDATNVNNWHWTEKNATPWSKDRLKSLFENFSVGEEDVECSVTELDTATGEATANNRKGKLIFFYEWKLVLKWSGKMPGEENAGTGKITIPNLSEENDLDDIEIAISIDESNDHSDKLKTFMCNVGRGKIRKQLGVYIKELKEEYSKGLILPRKDEVGQKPIKPDGVSNYASGFNKTVPKPSNGNTATPVAATVESKIKVETVKMTIQFQCRAAQLYDALTRTDMVQAFTHGPAKFEAVKGGEFSLFGGNVEGKFEELVPEKKLVQSWRLKQWPVGHFSNVVIDIVEKDSFTNLILTQTGVPSSEADTTINNWHRYYWNSIKSTFGFGSFLM